jgi:mono/diheme cytochrome c family protein
LDPSYTRTTQTFVGTPVPFAGFHGQSTSGGPPSTTSTSQSLASDAVARGHQLMVTAGCATCHGVTGRGGAVGPPIAGTDVADLRTKTDSGPGGMPAFDHRALSADDLAALTAYLKASVATGATTAGAATPTASSTGR